MTIEELEEFKGMSSEVNALEEEIFYLYTPYQSPSFDQVGSHNLTPSDPTSKAVDRINAKREELLIKRESMVQKLEEIEISEFWKMSWL